MKTIRLTVILGLGLLFLWPATVLRALESDPEATISKIKVHILDPNFNPHGIEQILAEALDVSLALLPPKEYSAEYRSRIEWVKTAFSDKHLFSDKIRQYLGLSYKLVANGEAWRLPEEIKTAPSAGEGMKAALKLCARFLDSAMTEIRARNNEKAVRHILDFVILVVTPVEA